MCVYVCIYESVCAYIVYRRKCEMRAKVEKKCEKAGKKEKKKKKKKHETLKQRTER